MIRGIGVDIVDTLRMQQAISRNAKFVERILTAKEIDSLPTRDQTSKRFVESVSARFAAKEAFAKSLNMSVFAFGFNNIEVLKDGDAPKIKLNGEVEKKYSLEKTKFFLSISHSDSSAIATVLAEYGN